MTLRKIHQGEFEVIYRKHQLWLDDVDKGERADFSDCNLTEIDFSYYRNLSSCFLNNANLSKRNLSNVNLDYANLNGVNLNGAKLCRSSLIDANIVNGQLIGATLQNANLRGANMRSANLKKANLSGSKFFRVNFEGAIFTNAILGDASFELSSLKDTNIGDAETDKANFDGAYLEDCLLKDSLQIKSYKPDDESASSKAKISDLKNKIRLLEKEKEELADGADGKSIFKKVDKEAEERILAIDVEIGAKKKDVKLLEQGEYIEKKLTRAFEKLEDLDSDTREDNKRLKRMFWAYIVAGLVFISLLGTLWMLAFCAFEGRPELVSFSKTWIYTAPSFILVGFVGVCVHQVSRAQRQLLALKMYNRKYKVVNIALKGYYDVEDQLKKSPDKAQEIFDLMMKQKIKKDIDLNHEEDKLKESEAKDKTIQDSLASTIIQSVAKKGLSDQN